MIRTTTTAFLAALVIGGTTLAQSADPPPAPQPPQAPVVAPALPQVAPSAPTCAEGCAPPTDDTSLWVRVMALAGWTKGDLPPVLLTTSPAGTPRALAGVPAGPLTIPLFGGRNVNEQARGGFDTEIGYWFDCQHNAGIEAGFSVLSGEGAGLLLSSNGNPILARPYLDIRTTTAASSLIAFPGVSTGSVHVSDSSHQIWNGHLDVDETWCCGKWWKVESLFGYRYFRFDERIQIDQSVTPIGGLFVPGTTIQSSDYFATGNIFHGVDLAVRTTFWFDSFSIEATGRVPAGYLTRNVSVTGLTTTSVPGFAPVTAVGGLLALPTNIGRHDNHTLTTMPEIGLLLNWQLNRYLRLQVGYDATWLIEMLRVGTQLDQTINPSQIPPATPALAGGFARPGFALATRDFWVQTISLGVEFRY
jgi:hypothetical protein